MRAARLLLSLALLLCACSNKDDPMANLPDMSAVRANLAFTCAHEAAVLPPLDPEADSLFRYARHLQKADGPKDYNQMARYYRIAAAHGHYKANRNLQNLLAYGQATSPDASKEVIDLAAQLIEQGVPGGYYDIGHYLEIGYGLKQDPEMALRYFRKAADLGSPDAQFYVGDLLEPWDKAPDIARQMYQCATDQGLGKAAGVLGIILKNRSRKNQSQYPEAVQAFQKGVTAGDTSSALALEHGFQGPPPTEELYHLSLPHDPERSRRYNLIRKFLNSNDGRNPKVPDIDQIVPLPPAKLPPWEGTFQWQKEQDAAVPPEKPSDELINRLSQAKHLDPATGLPLAPVAKTAQGKPSKSGPAVQRPLGTTAHSGERCPQSGLWRARHAAGIAGARQTFRQGDILPPLTGYDPRRFAWMDDLLGKRQLSVEVTWELIAYSNQA